MAFFFFPKGKWQQYSWHLFLLVFPFFLETSFRKFFLNYPRSDFFKEGRDLICNKGLAFGLDFNFNLIVFFNFFILLVLILWAAKSRDLGIRKDLLFLLSGAAFSNLMDRLRLGCVLDYIDLGFWPVFNIADTLIVASLVLLFVLYYKKEA